MATFKIFRETSLPSPLEPYSLYLIAPAGSSDLMEVVATNSDGSSTRRVLNRADVQGMIDSSITAHSSISVVADIAARDALSPTKSVFVYVEDATGDTTVNSGGATYLYDTSNSSWVKISEAESLDVVLKWANLQGGPNSTPAQIDGAVADAHTHSNKTELDGIGENGDGLLTYKGNQVKTEWSTLGW